MVTIRLIRFSDGKPAPGEKVYISRHSSGFLDVGGVYGSEITNRDGEVLFSKLDLPAKGEVFVNGHQVHNGELRQVMTFKI